ncbi:MAG TPA: NUDIX domain-containing protein, partial [Gemmatimonadaceae bacterium]
MVGRNQVTRRASSSGKPFSIDVVILTPRRKQLGVLCRREAVASGELPWGAPQKGESLEDGARRIARSACGVEPTWLEQLGAFGDGTSHPGAAVLSVAFVSVLPASRGEPAATEWADIRTAGSLVERHRLIVSAALEAVRERLDHVPVAFRLLPPLFTLTELQQVYETLLGRRLHKASFRRALHASWLV